MHGAGIGFPDAADMGLHVVSRTLPVQRCAHPQHPARLSAATFRVVHAALALPADFGT